MITSRFLAWSAWTADSGPPSDPFGLRESTRCLRAAAHVLAQLGVPTWTDTALVVASATGDPDAPAGVDALAHVPLRLADALRPAALTSICAGTNTVAMSLIETLCRLHTRDRVALLVIEPAPAAELAVAFGIDKGEGNATFHLEQGPRTTSSTRSRNPCRPALQLFQALAQQLGSVHVGERWTITVSWRDALGTAQ